MKKEFYEPEVEVIEFEVAEVIAEEPTASQGNEVEPPPSWGF